MKYVILACLAAAPGSGCVAKDKFAAGDSHYDIVAFELKSWGVPIDSWSVSADGTGEWVETLRTEGQGFRDYHLARHPLHLTPAQVAQVVRAAAAVPPPFDERSCKESVTDMPYGTLRLTRGGRTEELRFSNNCRDPGNLALIQRLQALDTLVSAWGKAAPALADGD